VATPVRRRGGSSPFTQLTLDRCLLFGYREVAETESLNDPCRTPAECAEAPPGASGRARPFRGTRGNACLDAAIVVAERWWRDERKAFQIASVFGCAPRLSLEVLRELRLILRWMRSKRMGAQYSAIIEALGEAPAARAAE
jgi:hypothetical protein